MIIVTVPLCVIIWCLRQSLLLFLLTFFSIIFINYYISPVAFALAKECTPFEREVADVFSLPPYQ